MGLLRREDCGWSRLILRRFQLTARTMQQTYLPDTSLHILPTVPHDRSLSSTIQSTTMISNKYTTQPASNVAHRVLLSHTETLPTGFQIAHSTGELRMVCNRFENLGRRKARCDSTMPSSSVVRSKAGHSIENDLGYLHIIY